MNLDLSGGVVSVIAGILVAGVVAIATWLISIPTLGSKLDTVEQSINRVEVRQQRMEAKIDEHGEAIARIEGAASVHKGK